jgi:hypothetical protein
MWKVHLTYSNQVLAASWQNHSTSLSASLYLTFRALSGAAQQPFQEVTAARSSIVLVRAKVFQLLGFMAAATMVTALTSATVQFDLLLSPMQRQQCSSNVGNWFKQLVTRPSSVRDCRRHPAPQTLPWGSLS